MRVSHWHERIAIYFTEDEVHRYYRPGKQLMLIHDLPNLRLMLSPLEGGAVINRAAVQEQEPWLVSFAVGRLPYTRFAATDVMFDEFDGQDLTLELPAADRLRWPHYKSCGSYDRPLQMSRDYLLRAMEEGAPPRCPLAIPYIIRNYVRQGRAAEALRLLEEKGNAFLTAGAGTKHCGQLSAVA